MVARGAKRICFPLHKIQRTKDVGRRQNISQGKQESDRGSIPHHLFLFHRILLKPGARRFCLLFIVLVLLRNSESKSGKFLSELQ